MMAPPNVDGAIAISLLSCTQNTSVQKASNGSSVTSRLSRFAIILNSLSLQLISDSKRAAELKGIDIMNFN